MRRRVTWRWVVGSTVLICAGWTGAAAGAQSAAPEPPPGGSRVEISSSPASPSTTSCLPGRLGMTYETATTSERFVLTVRSSAPRCEPIAATAVVYAMPSNGMAWPQRLVEARPVRIVDAGTVEIAFARTCAPTQFDVVTGATPERIAPWADWHGPLLFPFELASAFQDPGRDCAAPSTTVAPPAPTTPTPTTVAPSTTPPTTAAPSTSAPDEPTPTVDPSRDPDVEVLAVTTVPTGSSGSDTPVDPTSGSPSTPSVAGLALTGATTGILVAASLLMIVFGVGFVVGSWLRTKARS
jgi:hypothetical protein